MGEIVDIEFRPKKAQYVFECLCGGQHFYLHDDDTIECRSCNLISERIEWLYREGQAPTPKERR